MKKLEKAAILLSLIKKSMKKGNWCGETYVQKSVYILQTLFGNGLGYDFILYKYGPYSFDLKDSLTAMRADRFLELESHPPYGPKFAPGENSVFFDNHYLEIAEKFKSRLDFIAEKLGDYKVPELEKLATALYVLEKQGGKKKDEGEIAKCINELKPHIKVEEAIEFLRKAIGLKKEAESLIN